MCCSDVCCSDVLFRCVVQMCKATCEFGFLTLASMRFKRWPRLTLCFPSSPWSWCLVSRQAPSRSYTALISLDQHKNEKIEKLEAVDSCWRQDLKTLKSSKHVKTYKNISELFSAVLQVHPYKVQHHGSCCHVHDGHVLRSNVYKGCLLRSPFWILQVQEVQEVQSLIKMFNDAHGYSNWLLHWSLCGSIT